MNPLWQVQSKPGETQPPSWQHPESNILDTTQRHQNSAGKGNQTPHVAHSSAQERGGFFCPPGRKTVFVHVQNLRDQSTNEDRMKKCFSCTQTIQKQGPRNSPAMFKCLQLAAGGICLSVESELQLMSHKSTAVTTGYKHLTTSGHALNPKNSFMTHG